MGSIDQERKEKSDTKKNLSEKMKSIGQGRKRRLRIEKEKVERKKTLIKKKNFGQEKNF